MKRISRKVREEAALICAIAASKGEPISVRDVQSRIGAPMKSARLAVDAWACAHEGFRFGTYCKEILRDEYAEAEALLRTGWSPS